jgi:hypothetical protein
MRKDAASGRVAAALGGDDVGDGIDVEGVLPAVHASVAALAQRASHILGGGTEPDAPSRGLKASTRRASETAGNSVFTPSAPQSGPAWSALKTQDYAGSGIFEPSGPLPPPRVSTVPSAQQESLGVEGLIGAPSLGRSQLKSADYAGHGIFGTLPLSAPSPPPLALSDAKRSEMYYSNVFNEAEGPKPRRRSTGNSPVAAGPLEAGRLRDISSSWLTEAHAQPVIRAAGNASRQRHADMYTSAGDGLTMRFAESFADLPRPSAGGISRSGQSIASQFVLG